MRPISVAGEVFHLSRARDTERLSNVIGWPTDLLALCLELFHDDGLPGDLLGIQQFVQAIHTFMKVPRPGADLGAVLPEFATHRLTSERWRELCRSEITDLLDTVALLTLDGSASSDVRTDVEAQLQRIHTAAASSGREAGG
ncbi:MAG: hypothetical protein KC912_26850 [Proteobacteria bacterium]|nr:hypothetical protein [Pseudomonadota bacterium]